MIYKSPRLFLDGSLGSHYNCMSGSVPGRCGDKCGYGSGGYV